MKTAQYYKPVRQIGFALVAIGLLFHVFISFGALVKTNDDLPSGPIFVIALLLWACLPYLPALLLLRWLRNPIMPLCGVLGPFALDMLLFYNVILYPRSSTAAIALLFAPLWSLIILEPIGLLIGWPIGWIVAKRWPPNSCGAGEAPP